MRHLLRVLQEAALYEAADYISESVLHQGKVARLSDSDRSSERCESLPHPIWNDEKKIQDEKCNISSSNFNSLNEKELYNRKKQMTYDVLDKNRNDGSAADESTYLDLVKHDKHGLKYECLKPTNNDVRCHKEPSYISGDERSAQLEGPPKDVEHEIDPVSCVSVIICYLFYKSFTVVRLMS